MRRRGIQSLSDALKGLPVQVIQCVSVVHGFDDGWRQWFRDVADSQSNDTCRWIGMRKRGHSTTDFGKQIASFQLEKIFVHLNHEIMHLTENRWRCSYYSQLISCGPAKISDGTLQKLDKSDRKISDRKMNQRKTLLSVVYFSVLYFSVIYFFVGCVAP